LRLTPLRLREQTIRVGGAPTGIAFALRSAWVALSRALVEIDGATGVVKRRIALPQGGDYRDVAIAGTDAWVTDGAGRHAAIVDVDLTAGRIRRLIPIACCALGVAARGHDVWVTVPRDGPGLVLRIDARSGRIVARIPVGPGPSPIALAGARVWVWNTSAPTSLMAIDTATNTVAGAADVHGVSALASGPAGLWAGGNGLGLVRIDPRSGRILRRTAAVYGTQMLAVGERAVYAGGRSCSTCPASFVTRTGLAEGIASAPLPVGDTAVALAVGGGALWSADFASGTVTRIPFPLA
jgi:DNA-binding beta-propeller fold protein YncE